MCPESNFWIDQNWPWIGKMTMTSQFSDMMSSSIFFDVVLFFLASLVTGESFMPILSLVLELWQFSFTRDWPEIWKLEVPIWVLPNIWRLWQVRDTKFGTNASNEMLQHYRVTAFTVSDLFRENQQGVKLPPTQIRVKADSILILTLEIGQV